MNEGLQALVVIVVVGGVMLIYGRRLLRLFRRRTIRPRTTAIRGGVLIALSLLLFLAPAASPEMKTLGFAIGSLLGLAAGLLARITRSRGRIYSNPNRWIGGLVAVALVARLGSRIVARHEAGDPWGLDAGAGINAAARATSVELLIVVLAFFGVLNLVLALRGRKLARRAASKTASPHTGVD